MTDRTNPTELPPPGWRFRMGVSLFVLGFLSPLGIPLVTATNLSTAWKATLSGLFMLGIPELFWLVAAAIMGKTGFNYIKGKVFGFFRRYATPKEVSRTRYSIGLVMFVIPLLFGWLAPYGVHLIPGYEQHRFAVNLGGDLLLFASLFVLGGDFWDKVRALFTYRATAQFPQSKPV